MKGLVRSVSLDTLRTIAILMVITIHTTGQFVLDVSQKDFGYYTASFFESIVQIGVPIFVMLSGTFILDKKIDCWKDFYQKRLPKLIIPFVVWLPLNWLWLVIKGDNLLSIIINGGGLLQLWFIPMLLILYIITPLLQIVVRRIELSKRPFRYLVLFTTLLFFIGFGDELYAEFSLHPPYPYYPFFSLRYAGFFVAGYLLRKYPLERRMSIVVTSVVYLLSIAGIMIFANVIWSKTNEYFYHNLSPFIIIQALALFALFSSRRGVERIKPNILSRQHSFVLGIYLVHIIWLNIVTKAFLILTPHFMQIPFVNVPVRVIIVFVVSLISVRFLSKIPIIRSTLLG